MHNTFKFSLCVIAFLGRTMIGQVVPPCGLDYGSTSDEANIITQMRYGSIANAVAAINTAKNTRGTSLGCPQSALTYSPSNISEPSLSTIVNIWNTVHVPAINSFSVNCPRIARYESNAALGAYYASLAGYYNNFSKLSEIADMMVDQQYVTWNISNPAPRNEGVYGYLNVASSNSCYIGGVVGSGVTSLCSALPQYCVTYSNGQFTGKNFAISGQDDGSNWFDGGLAYDHGWAGIMMIESSLQQTNSALKQKYRNSVAAAGQYAISEYCVKNHNYTAKLIWLLAELYEWTGSSIYSNELNYKLDKNLIPGILWDANNDGFVDGMSPAISFTNLTACAQTPGRMWDAHNSLPWYHAMNTWAITEAYVAFRDRGDLSRANQLKPYVIAMVDNLANEILVKGVVSPDQLGVRDITYALLTAIWKVSSYENEAHANWRNAAWAMWNSGYFNTYSTHSVCVGLYLIVKNNTPYVPIHLREAFVLSAIDNKLNANSIRLIPNPASDHVLLTIKDYDNLTVKIFDVNGKCIYDQKLINKSGEFTIDVSNLDQGMYFISVHNSSSVVYSTKLIKD